MARSVRERARDDFYWRHVVPRYWRAVRDTFTLRAVGAFFRCLFFCIAIASLSIAPFLMNWHATTTPVPELTLQLLGGEFLWGLGLTCGWIGFARWAFTDNEPWYEQWAICGFAALAALSAVTYAVS